MLTPWDLAAPKLQRKNDSTSLRDGVARHAPLKRTGRRTDDISERRLGEAKTNEEVEHGKVALVRCIVRLLGSNTRGELACDSLGETQCYRWQFRPQDITGG